MPAPTAGGLAWEPGADGTFYAEHGPYILAAERGRWRVALAYDELPYRSPVLAERWGDWSATEAAQAAVAACREIDSAWAAARKPWPTGD